MPDQQRGVFAQLSVRDGRAAVAFYQNAFGAQVVYQVGGTDEEPAVVAQLSVGATTFWVADESPEHENYSPETLGGGTIRLLLVVEDPEAAVTRAVDLGSRLVTPVQRDYGWLLGRICDPFGHHWEVGHPVGEWPPSHA